MKHIYRLVIILAVLLCACNRNANILIDPGYTQEEYDTALNDGIQNIKVIQEFVSIFPDAHHFITHYPKEFKDQMWNSKVGLHGRYILSIQIPIGFDKDHRLPQQIREPEFYLNEVENIKILPNGRKLISYTGRSMHFGMDKWEILLKNHGRLESIGVDVKGGSPVHGFHESWKSA